MPPESLKDSNGMNSPTQVFVVGNGVTKFKVPGKMKHGYADEAAEAATMALAECGLAFTDIQSVVAGYVYGDSTCGQAASYRLGLSGVPVFNVNNNCATGSTALHLAKRLVESGDDCVLALGFEEMGKNLKEYFPDREKPAQRHLSTMTAAGIPVEPLPGAYTELTQAVLKCYGHAAAQHMAQHGTTQLQFAKVAAKNHRHSQHNPYALMQFDIKPDDALAAPPLPGGPLTVAMAAPLACGAAAAVVVSHRFLQQHPALRQLQQRSGGRHAVCILGQAVTSDTAVTFDAGSALCASNLCGYEISSRAARLAYKAAGVGPESVDVAEVSPGKPWLEARHGTTKHMHSSSRHCTTSTAQ